MTKPRINLSLAHMTGKELQYINEAFETNWIAPIGSNVDAFEKEFAKTVGAEAALAVSSGTAAIHLALSLLDVTKGDSVFCSTLTCVASAKPILYQGAEPVFIDSEPESWNMSPDALKRAMEEAASVKKLPKAVIVVNLYGQSSKMDEILRICNLYGVPIIEDAAESLGTTYKGKASGTLGKFGIYSFNCNKIITTSGGGMLVSDDKEVVNRVCFLASRARDSALYYQHSVRLSNLRAGVGWTQLQVLESRVKARRRLFELYFHALSDLPGVNFMPELKETKANRWLTTLSLDEEKAGVTVNQLLGAFQRENIEARSVWNPLHMQPLFKENSYYPHRENNHVAERLFATGICLPSGAGLTGEEQLRVIKCFRDVFNKTIINRNYLILGKHEV